MENEKPKVVFLPGDFDDFTGTQEELDRFVQIITESVQNGTFQDSHSASPDEDDEEPEFTEEELEAITLARVEERQRSLH